LPLSEGVVVVAVEEAAEEVEEGRFGKPPRILPGATRKQTQSVSYPFYFDLRT